VKLTILLAGASLFALLLRRTAAVVRYRLWIATMIAALVVPAIPEVVQVRIPILPAVSTAVTRTEIAPNAESPAPREREVAAILENTAFSESERSPFDYLAIAWLFGSVFLAARLAWSTVIVRRIVGRGQPLSERSWTDLLYESADRLGLDTVPDLVRSRDTPVALACRVRRPTIVLPIGADEWPEERRRVVLLHELAHVKRRDLLGHTLSRVVCAIYWFHPLAWFAAHRLRAESERACDDLVLFGGETPSSYAQQLLSVVAELRSHAAPATAMAMSAHREFEGRIVAILDPNLPRRSRGAAEAMFPVALIATFGLSLAVVQPSARAATKLTTRDTPNVTIPQDPTTLTRLLLTDTSAAVRRSAAWSLNARPEAAPALITALRADRDASVREMAVWALGQHGDTAVLPVLYSHLKTEADGAVRATTVWATGQVHGRSGEILPLLDDRDARVARMAVWAIGQTPPSSAPAAIVGKLRSPDAGLRLLAAWTLGEIGDNATVPALHSALGVERDTVVQLAIFRALFESGDRSSALVDAGLRSANVQIRERATQVLAGQKPRPWPWPWPLPDPRD
jgi:beta-lactamase regulating signal transducer with metallopeptidase domain/HEAT repeat protein